MFVIPFLFSLQILFFSPLFAGDIDVHHSASFPEKRHFEMLKNSFKIKSVRPFPRIEKPKESSWGGHLSAQNFKTNAEKAELFNHQKSVRTVLKNLPAGHTSSLQKLEIKNEKHVSRGMANSKKVILNTGNIDTQNELMAVFIHELGHIVDLGKMKGKDGKKTLFYDGKIPVLSDDDSLGFYRISWKDAKNRKKDSDWKDFITGYAMTNPFEDFAEHYLFYRLHGEKFRSAQKYSKVLAKKYAFLKDKVFNGKEFQIEKVVQNPFVPGVMWDATLMDYQIRDLIAAN